MKRNTPGKENTTKNQDNHLTRREGEDNETTHRDFYQSIADILRAARANAYRAINFTMVEAYWNIGRKIVEEEQRGKQRAGYGASLLKDLSVRLGSEFGAGFSEQSLRNMRQFYRCFPIRSALRSELSWSHYKVLIRIEKEVSRAWYLQEAADQNWSTRALARQIHSLYYERLLMSRDKAPVVEEMQQMTTPLAPTPRDFIKDPYVLEFLGLRDNYEFRETELEQAIIDKLQSFMLEMGKALPSSAASSASPPRPRISTSTWSSTTTSSNASFWSISRLANLPTRTSARWICMSDCSRTP